MDGVQPLMTELTEDQALAIAVEAVDRAGGTREVYRNPRHPFARDATLDYVIDGIDVELRHGEISSPAIVSVAGWVFEIHEESLDLLMRPPRPKRSTP